MDLAELALDINRAERLTLDPTDELPEDRAPYFLVRSWDHPENQEALLNERRAILKRVAASKKLRTDDIDDRAIDMEAALRCVVGWGNITKNGQPVPFDPDELRRMLSMPSYAWIVERVLAFARDRARFFGSASNKS